MPHTADVRIEAWAPSRERCVAEAVAAMVESFADLRGRAATGAVEVHFDPGSDEDLLIDVLEEVIYLLETVGELPVRAEVSPTGPDGDGLRVRFQTADAELAEPVGAAPKAVALHDLRFGPNHVGWFCAVTLDV
jgi:SHS2 domain-containing protein